MRVNKPIERLQYFIQATALYCSRVVAIVEGHDCKDIWTTNSVGVLGLHSLFWFNYTFLFCLANDETINLDADLDVNGALISVLELFILFALFLRKAEFM